MPKAIEYEEYFGEMDISEAEIRERIRLAEEVDDVFFFLFALILMQRATNKDFDLDNLTQSTIIRYKEALVRFGYNLEKANFYLNGYVEEITPPIVKTTIEHIDDPYYTSEDRAKSIAENEANSVKNYVAYKNAVKEGMTRKRWITKRDKFVRHTHLMVDDKEIGIKDYFQVGDSLMLYPKDIIHGEEKECVNCRCVLQYTGKKQMKPEEVKASVDEMHIGTTDDLLHIGTTDDKLHVGTTDDLLHIGTTDDKLHVAGILERFVSNMGVIALYTPAELKIMFIEQGYAVAEEGEEYKIDLGNGEYLVFKGTYFIYHTKDMEIKLDLKGNII